MTASIKNAKLLRTVPVKSMSAGGLIYSVNLFSDGAHTCTCPDYRHRRHQCKHITQARRMFVQLSQDEKLRDIGSIIYDFFRETNEDEYTDVGDAWETFGAIYRIATGKDLE